MSNKRFDLVSGLIALSNANIWDQAVTEWELFDWYDQPGSSCLCGKTNIRYMSVLKNAITGHTVEVGSECVVTITSHRPDLIYTAVNRVRENIEDRLNSEALEYYIRKGVIEGPSVQFYRDMLRKRNLTEKQLRWMRGLNNRVLEYIARQNAIRVPTLQKAIEIAMTPLHYISRDMFTLSNDRSNLVTEYSQLKDRVVPETRYIESMFAERPVYAVKSSRTGTVIEFVQFEQRLTAERELECDIYRPLETAYAHLSLTIYND